MFLLISGLFLLAIIIALFWLKDYLRSPLLARVVFSGLIARLAVIGAVFVLLGMLLELSRLIDKWML